MAVSEPGGIEHHGDLKELYRQHAAWLRRAIRPASGTQFAEDAVQETFLRLARYEGLLVLKHPRALLLRVAQNIVHSSQRSPRQSVLKQFDYAPTVIDQSVMASQVETILLRQTILSLPEIYKDVILLSRFGGLSYAEIATERGIALKTVEWRMSRALKLCADKLRE